MVRLTDVGASAPATAMRYMGLAFPLTVVLMLWNTMPILARAVSGVGIFSAVATGAGLLLAGILMVLALRGRRECGPRANALSAFGAGAGLLVLYAAVRWDWGSLAVWLAATATGLGLPVQIVLWGQRYGSLSLQQSFVWTCRAVLTASLATCLLDIAGILGLAMAGIGMFVSGAMLACSDQEDVPQTEFAASVAAIRLAAFDLWRPIAGAGLCLMIVGFVMGSELIGEPLTGSGVSLYVQMAGWVFAAGCLPILARLVSNRFSLNMLLQLLLPLLTCVLILGWIVRPAGLSVACGYATSFATGLCNGALVVAVWVYLVATVREGGVSPTVVFAGACVLLGLCVLVPAILFSVIHHTVAQVVVPTLTVVYLAVTGIELIARETDAPPMAEPRNIDDSCDEVGRQFALSPRELEVLKLLARGRTGDYIADVLGISPHTVKSHIKHIHQKLGVSSRQEIIDIIETRM